MNGHVLNTFRTLNWYDGIKKMKSKLDGFTSKKKAWAQDVLLELITLQVVPNSSISTSVANSNIQINLIPMLQPAILEKTMRTSTVTFPVFTGGKYKIVISNA